MEDINPDDIIDMCVTKDGLALMYKSVCFHLDKWAGGHPHEQEALVQMKDNLLRIMLEQQFKKPQGPIFWREFFFDFLVIKGRFSFCPSVLQLSYASSLGYLYLSHYDGIHVVHER